MNNFRGFLFDLDGTIYAGTKLIDGATDLLTLLRKEGKTIAFMTNNSTLNAAEIRMKLAKFGVPAEEEEIICPTDCAGTFLTDHFGPSNVYVIGSDALKENVARSGHTLLHSVNAHCDVVLVGRDLEFTYRKLEDASIHVQKGALLVATNMDHTHPIQTGDDVPETGALVAAIQATVSIEPLIIGKPDAYLYDTALKRFGLTPEDTVMIGDNPLTDIQGGINAGLHSVLIDLHGKKMLPMTGDVRTVERLKDLYDTYRQSLVTGGL
ncbi:HAD-IIA family hydrolase [Alkalihalobacillus sp. CinArs1]|uniref:HAD-IIA family hydrolase n=1 Tax=Alkalihalobacillus sp. CinArs1 TaxID=2995314 RepID=UPI0022DD41E3|nr:HAD-IIA family hydrolase [Alkalihalobacillus sp. CinArs1]